MVYIRVLVLTTVHLARVGRSDVDQQRHARDGGDGIVVYYFGRCPRFPRTPLDDIGGNEKRKRGAEWLGGRRKPGDVSRSVLARGLLLGGVHWAS